MLKRILSHFLKPLYFYLTSKRHRAHAKLKFKYGGIQAYQERSVQFLTYRMSVPDVPSFLDQYESIFFNHCYRFETSNPKPLIYDCGANIGMASLYFKSQYPAATVKAFEADPQIARFLKENLKKNNISNVEVLEKAVWIDQQGVAFQQEGGQGGRIDQNRHEIKTKIPSIRLKDLLQKETSIDFLKLDIEGAELAVLRDCSDQLYKVKHLFVEYHFFNTGKNYLSELLKILEDAGFSYFVQNNSIFQPFLFRSSKTVAFTVEIFAQQKDT